MSASLRVVAALTGVTIVPAHGNPVALLRSSDLCDLTRRSTSMQVLTVTTDSQPPYLAHIIAKIIRNGEVPELTAVTTEATARALKTIVIANIELAQTGLAVVRAELDQAAG